MKFDPKPDDLPADEAITRAQELILSEGGSKFADVQFQFTCELCGVRCTPVERNTYYMTGECFACGKVTTIQRYGVKLVKRAASDDEKL